LRRRLVAFGLLGALLLGGCRSSDGGSSAGTNLIDDSEPRSSLLGDVLREGTTAGTRWRFYSVDSQQENYLCGVVLTETDADWPATAGEVIETAPSCHPDYRRKAFPIRHDLVSIVQVTLDTDLGLTDLHVGVASPEVVRAVLSFVDGKDVEVALGNSTFAVEVPRVAITRIELTLRDGGRVECNIDDLIIPIGPFIC
jgi:hypothetical protein